MKKLYSLILIALPFFSAAQPIIDQTDEPVAGLMFATGIDNNYSAPIPSGGASQIWNYSTLMLTDTGGGHFISSAGTPHEAAFAPANLAVYDSSNGGWAYFLTSSTGFYVKGGDSAGVQIVLNPAWMWVPIPFTYNDSVYSRARFQVDTLYDFGFGPVPVRYIRTYDDYFIGDGYGTLTVPGNTFSNTLRIKNREFITDTILADPFGTGYMIIPGYEPTSSQIHNYRWLRHNGPDVFLLEIRADSLGTTGTRSEYQIASLISVPEINATSQLTPYPNPTSNVIHIDFEKAETGTIEVFNSIGEMVSWHSFNDINKYVMHTYSLANGLYYFHVKTTRSEVKHGRFIVSH
jgi:hypothetical protein